MALPPITDFATILQQPAIDNNHAFFAQDAWTVGHGLTLNLGIRVEKENLPVPNGVIPTGFRQTDRDQLLVGRQD